MLQIKEIVNSIFTSKTYIIYREGCDKAWLVDIGDIEPVLAFCEEEGLKVQGVFLTHGHFDHIYGLLPLLEYFPACKIYTSEFGKASLGSDKLNLSRFHELPISYHGDSVVVLHDGDKLSLYDEEPLMLSYETPGHNPGCLTMSLGNYIFTGDAYIPGIKTNTTLPYANKEQAQQSLERILKLAKGKVILAGHLV